jgi:hypothetical protein
MMPEGLHVLVDMKLDRLLHSSVYEQGQRTNECSGGRNERRVQIDTTIPSPLPLLFPIVL